MGWITAMTRLRPMPKTTSPDRLLSIRARAPSASSDRVRRVMQANPSRDTSPEKVLRSRLHKAGLRFRKDAPPVANLRCKADIVFRSARVCVFVDGCFWHGCPQHFRAPKTNRAWWLEKVEDNRVRDREKTRALREHGWTVLRFWEHELNRQNLEAVLRKIEKSVRTSE